LIAGRRFFDCGSRKKIGNGQFRQSFLKNRLKNFPKEVYWFMILRGALLQANR
jgi:hypothetical protein